MAANGDFDDDELAADEEPAPPRSKVPYHLILGAGLVVVVLGPLLAVLVFVVGGGSEPEPTGANELPGVVATAPKGDGEDVLSGPALGALGRAGADRPAAAPVQEPAGPVFPLPPPVAAGDIGVATIAKGRRPSFEPAMPDDGQPLYQWETEAGHVTGLALLPDEQFLLLGTNNSIRIIDLATGKERNRFAEGIHHTTAALSSDGKRLLTGSGSVEAQNGQRTPRDCVVRLWEVDKGRQLRRLEGHTRPITTVAFSRDGRWALSAGGGEDRGENNTKVSIDSGIRVWNLVTYQQTLLLEGHRGGVRCVAFAPHDLTCLSGGNDGTLRRWSLGSGQREVVMQAGAPVTSVAFTSDTARAISGHTDGSVILWDVRTGQPLRRFEVPNESKYVHWVGMTRDGRRLLSAHGWIEAQAGKTVPVDPTVRCWDLSASDDPQSFTEHTQMVKTVAVSQTGAWLVSAGQDRAVRLWRFVE